ncbi:hypothetical protein [Beduinella massiliensis]|uniref:hypothetical protein n=1 Tax=Beduinella massiliensis TaxID=1852363 RepID=UPI000C83EF4E
MNYNGIYPRIVKINDAINIDGDDALICVVRQFCGDDVANMLEDRLEIRSRAMSLKDVLEHLEGVRNALDDAMEEVEGARYALDEIERGPL